MKLTMIAFLLIIFARSCLANHLSVITTIAVSEQSEQRLSGELITQIFNGTGARVENLNLCLVNSGEVTLDAQILQFFAIKGGGVRHTTSRFSAQPLYIKPTRSILWRINYDNASGHHQEFFSSKVNARVQ